MRYEPSLEAHTTQCYAIISFALLSRLWLCTLTVTNTGYYIQQVGEGSSQWRNPQPGN